jgi:hypothetical protein
LPPGLTGMRLEWTSIPDVTSAVLPSHHDLLLIAAELWLSGVRALLGAAAAVAVELNDRSVLVHCTGRAGPALLPVKYPLKQWALFWIWKKKG